MARPLLASDVPGCREIVRHGDNGLLFEVRSEEKLAEAIERFIEAGPEQRRRWASINRLPQLSARVKALEGGKPAAEE